MAKQQAKAQDNTTRWIVIAMVLLVVVTGVVFSLMSQNNKVGVLASLRGKKAVVNLGTMPLQVNFDDLVAVIEKQVEQ